METIVIGAVAVLIFIIGVGYWTKRNPPTPFKKPPTTTEPHVPGIDPDPWVDATFANQERQRQEAKEQAQRDNPPPQ